MLRVLNRVGDLNVCDKRIQACMPGERIGIRQDRLRVVIADLLVFDASRLAWRLDLRTVGRLLLPVLLGRLLDMPSLFGSELAHICSPSVIH